MEKACLFKQLSILIQVKSMSQMLNQLEIVLQHGNVVQTMV